MAHLLHEVSKYVHLSISVGEKRKNPARKCMLTLSVLLLFGLVCSKAFGESPAPSVHWGSLAFPDQYSTLNTGLTLDRFTPVDGAGAKYDSTVTNTLGFNLITFSWTQHGHDRFEGWSINVTGGISPTANQPSEFFQNKVIHQLRHLPPVPSFQPRQDTDAMFDGSATKWFFKNKTGFWGGGFSAGTIYQEQFLRAGIRRLQVTPDLYHGDWRAVSVRLSGLGRVSVQENGAVLHQTKPTSHIFQPALAIGQYNTNEVNNIQHGRSKFQPHGIPEFLSMGLGKAGNSSFGPRLSLAARSVLRHGTIVWET